MLTVQRWFRRWTTGPLALVDVQDQLRVGANVLGARVQNDGGNAGAIAALWIVSEDGAVTEVQTDATWEGRVTASDGWLLPGGGVTVGSGPVEVVAPFGASPFVDRPTLALDTPPSPYFRKSFTVSKGVRRVTAHISGVGYHELYLNGARVGDHVLEPTYTDYSKRVEYVTHDVTDLVRTGDNTIGAILGNGFYNQHARDAWQFHQASWRGRPRLNMALEVELEDGSVQTVLTDETWRWTDGPIRSDGVRNGELYDARLTLEGWADPDNTDGSASSEASQSIGDWRPVDVVEPPGGNLVPQAHEPMRVVDTLEAVTEPVKVADGIWRFDFGQNIAGWVNLKLSAPRGTKVTLRYGERLQSNGRLDQRQIDRFVYQGVAQQDTYIARGGGVETWRPRFAYHGFQYVEVSGLPSAPGRDLLTAEIVHTDFRQTGSIETSNSLLDQLNKATDWAFRGNFHGIPTDCPQREKNGWTGDAHLAVETGLFAYDSALAYRKWSLDLVDAQNADGALPGIVPSGGWGFGRYSGPVWEAALFLVPWAVYTHNADQSLLEEVFPAWQRYLTYVDGRADDGVVDFGLGDWTPFKAETPEIITSTGYYHHLTVLAARVAGILGDPGAQQVFEANAARIREGFRRAIIAGPGRLTNAAYETQTAYGLILAFELYEGAAEADAFLEKLVDSIERGGRHLDTGVVGGKLVLQALTAHGRADLAYALIAQDTFPSWGYWIRQGATTLWESWEGERSRNHVFWGYFTPGCTTTWRASNRTRTRLGFLVFSCVLSRLMGWTTSRRPTTQSAGRCAAPGAGKGRP